MAKQALTCAELNHVAGNKSEKGDNNSLERQFLSGRNRREAVGPVGYLSQSLDACFGTEFLDNLGLVAA